KIRGIPFESKKPLQVYYKGQRLDQKYIPDVMVCDQIVVELKAVQTLIPEHEAQLINYMRITQQPVGYLINFRADRQGTMETLHTLRLPQALTPRRGARHATTLASISVH